MRPRSAPSPSPSAPGPSLRGLRLPATRATHAASGAARRLPEAGGSACGDSVAPRPRHGSRAETRGERRTPATPRQGDAPRTPGRAARRVAAPLRPDRGPRDGRGLARCPDRSGDWPAGSDTRRPPLGDRGDGHRGPRGADAPADGPSPVDLPAREPGMRPAAPRRGHEACGAAPDAAEPTHAHGRQGPPRHPHPREGAGARKGGTPAGAPAHKPGREARSAGTPRSAQIAPCLRRPLGRFQEAEAGFDLRGEDAAFPEDPGECRRRFREGEE